MISLIMKESHYHNLVSKKNNANVLLPNFAFQEPLEYYNLGGHHYQYFKCTAQLTI